MTVGDRIEVTLPETATTGFRWQPDIDERLVTHVGEQIHATAMPRGAPGSRTLVFQALHPGHGVLRLVKRRPWETGSSDEEEFTVHLDVAPGS